MAAGFANFWPKSTWFLGRSFCVRCSKSISKRNITCTSNNRQVKETSSQYDDNSDDILKPNESVLEDDTEPQMVEDNGSNQSKIEEIYAYDQDGKRNEKTDGLFYLNMIHLPKDLKQSLAKFYKKYPAKVLTSDGQQLARYLRNRGRPTEGSWKKFKESKNEPKITDKEESAKDKAGEDQSMDNLKLDSGNPLEGESESQVVLKRDLKTQSKRPKKNSYTMLRYGKKEVAAFAASRVPACFGATKRVFSEIQKREPDFQPKTLLDFGSGTGTALWAANDIWGKSLKEYQCVDISDDSNRVCEFLLRGDDDPNQPLKIPGVYFRKFLPLSNKITYDVVVASYTLSEMPFRKQRQAAISSLWAKTNDFLILIEPGNNEGFDIALQARDHVTKREDNTVDVFSEETEMAEGFNIDDDVNDDAFYNLEEEIDPGFVYAPCPHDVACPRSEVDGRDHPCNFEQKVELSFSQRNTALKRWGYVRERFSYLVLRKGQRDKTENEFSRILHPPKRRTRHVFCEICRGNGSIERHVLTKRKDPQLYKGVRHCLKWGDLMPDIDSEKKPLKVIRLDNQTN